VRGPAPCPRGHAGISIEGHVRSPGGFAPGLGRGKWRDWAGRRRAGGGAQGHGHFQKGPWVCLSTGGGGGYGQGPIPDHRSDQASLSGYRRAVWGYGFGVERGIRYAVETAWSRSDAGTLERLLGEPIKGKPTNGEFIAGLVHLLEEEGRDCPQSAW